MHNAHFHFDKSFEVRDAVSLRDDLTKIGPRVPVVLDFRDVQFITETAVDALAAAIKSLTGRKVFGIGFEGIGLEQFRALGVVC